MFSDLVPGRAAGGVCSWPGNICDREAPSDLRGVSSGLRGFAAAAELWSKRELENPVLS